MLVLANVVYFNGRWLHPFELKNTRPAAFHVSAARTIEVPTMHQTEDFGYAWDDEVQLLELAYRGDELAMVVVLPKAVDGLGAIEEGLTAARLIAWMNLLSGRGTVRVALPKFRTTSALSLTEPLKVLGMTNAFGRADFSGMFVAPGPRISQVVHQAFVSVDEVGTEAAASTAVIMKSSLPAFVQVDRPFLFLIRDRSTGNILFLGRIADPAQS